jgi:hypothetical protein
VIVRFPLDDEAITLQTNAFHAMSKPKYSKAGSAPQGVELSVPLSFRGRSPRFLAVARTITYMFMVRR